MQPRFSFLTVLAIVLCAALVAGGVIAIVLGGESTAETLERLACNDPVLRAHAYCPPDPGFLTHLRLLGIGAIIAGFAFAMLAEISRQLARTEDITLSMERQNDAILRELRDRRHD